MKRTVRALVLYTQLNGYTTCCLETLVKEAKAEVLVFAHRNTLAPFSFPETSFQLFYVEDIAFRDFVSICHEFKPNIVLISGWAHRNYLWLGWAFRRLGVPVVCMADTKWTGDFRQRTLSFCGGWLLRRIFTHYWGAGLYQYEMARNCGFKPENVLLGVYSGDCARFSEAFENSQDSRATYYPKTFIYVGRFSTEKGVLLLYEAFNCLVRQGKNKGWRLMFVGAGPLEAKMKPNDNIQIRAFVQPQELPNLVAEGGGFVMPSFNDQWCVALHEFAAGGLPLVCSDAVGAHTAFLRHRYNGYRFRAGSLEDLVDGLKFIVDSSDERLIEMGKRSHDLSHQYNPSMWVTNIENLARLRLKPTSPKSNVRG